MLLGLRQDANSPDTCKLTHLRRMRGASQARGSHWVDQLTSVFGGVGVIPEQKKLVLEHLLFKKAKD